MVLPWRIDLCLEGVDFVHQVRHDVPRRIHGRTRLARFERIVGARGHVAKPAEVIELSVKLLTKDSRTRLSQRRCYAAQQRFMPIGALRPLLTQQLKYPVE